MAPWRSSREPAQFHVLFLSVQSAARAPALLLLLLQQLNAQGAQLKTAKWELPALGGQLHTWPHFIGRMGATLRAARMRK